MKHETATTADILGTRHTAPGFQVPRGSCDCHVHVFGPADQYPLAKGRAYTPGPASLDDLRTHQAILGLDRVVLVQPSVYGTDNSCVVDVLGQLGTSARAVAVVAPDITPSEASALNSAGVRGIRVNLGTHGVADPATGTSRLAEAARVAADQGWHIQVYAPLPVLVSLASTLTTLPVPVVFDHFAMADAALGTDQPGLSFICGLLAEGRAYVKLSAPHRVSQSANLADIPPLLHAFAKANPDALLWASDWPHTTTQGFAGSDDGTALDRFVSWVGDDSLVHRILVSTPAHLYDFQDRAHD